MINTEILKFFPEPIFKYKLNDFTNINEELSNYIYRLKDQDTKGLQRSNQGGWHSQNF